MNIRVLRESGGLGDIVRILPVVRALREKYPDAQIHVFAPEQYHCLIERAGEADRIVATPHNRRPRLAPADEALFPYLNTGVKYNLTVDLYCPAFRHEADMRGEVWNDRIELFCRAADAWPHSITPSVPVSVAERAAARNLLSNLGVRRKKGWVALQPFSTDPARDWPPGNWRALGAMLIKHGYGVFILDCVAGRTRDWGIPQVIGLPYLELAAVLAVSDLLVCPDSGLAHLCGAVGGRALGLTASQSGAVLYRHYPRHSYIQPGAVGPEFRNPKSEIRNCKWPCYWSRPRDCQRMNLRSRNATCPLLATLSVEAVAEAARDIIERGDVRSAARAAWQGGMAPSAGTIRMVERAVPARSSILDVGGTLARGLRAAGVRHDLRPEACHVLPIPAFDRMADNAALFGLPEGDDPADWFWELFRVLKVGGRVIVDERCLAAAMEMGFQLRERDAGFAVLYKVATWPQRGPPQVLSAPP